MISEDELQNPAASALNVLGVDEEYRIRAVGANYLVGHTEGLRVTLTPEGIQAITMDQDGLGSMFRGMADFIIQHGDYRPTGKDAASQGVGLDLTLNQPSLGLRDSLRDKPPIATYNRLQPPPAVTIRTYPDPKRGEAALVGGLWLHRRLRETEAPEPAAIAGPYLSLGVPAPLIMFEPHNSNARVIVSKKAQGIAAKDLWRAANRSSGQRFRETAERLEAAIGPTSLTKILVQRLGRASLDLINLRPRAPHGRRGAWTIHPGIIIGSVSESDDGWPRASVALTELPTVETDAQLRRVRSRLVQLNKAA